MLRSAAVARIQRGLGFRSIPSGIIEDALREAQRELEAGKSLPPFLLKTDQPVALASGTNSVPLPSNFLRESDDNRLHYFADNSTAPYYIRPRPYQVASTTWADRNSGGPQVYAIRNGLIFFFPIADKDYTLYWDYYVRGDILNSNEENVWLNDEHVPEWLIGEAGLRVALDLRDQTAQQVFSTMAQKARASLLGEIVVTEDVDGPLILGENN